MLAFLLNAGVLELLVIVAVLAFLMAPLAIAGIVLALVLKKRRGEEPPESAPRV